VQTITDQSVGTSTAAGNSYQASVDGGDLDVRSNQSNSGAVTANNLMNVATQSGAQAALTTTAAGNTSETDVSGGVLTAVVNQTSGPASVQALSHIEAPDAQGGDVSAVLQAQGNNHVISVNSGTAGVRVTQENSGQVVSDGGGVYGLVTGTASFNAVTQGNDISLNGDNGSAERTITTQTNDTDLTQASQFTAFGQVQTGRTTVSASGNTFSAVNHGALLDATSSQTNHSYVRAQAETSAAAFGSLSVAANGVGNEAMVGDVGGEVMLDNTQVNDGGGIEVLATLTGGDGYDAQATASAAGNSVTGYACASCNGHMTVTNSQTNAADVGATSTTTLTGQARSAVGVAHAVGNSATYYVSKPSGN